jgi:cobalt-zinc-cadmium resistance protein CzcA
MYTGWGGTFESLQSARLRLMLVVPVCFAAIYGLLYLALGGFAPAGIVFSAVPMALAGGVFALLLRGIPFSITAAVGFIALSGVAVLNGLVMMEAIRRHQSEGAQDEQAIIGGAMERVRPVLMTALVASLRLCAHGAGHRHGRRGAAPAGHGGDRRSGDLDRADAVGVARHHRLGRSHAARVR